MRGLLFVLFFPSVLYVFVTSWPLAAPLNEILPQMANRILSFFQDWNNRSIFLAFVYFSAWPCGCPTVHISKKSADKPELSSEYILHAHTRTKNATLLLWASVKRPNIFPDLTRRLWIYVAPTQHIQSQNRGTWPQDLNFLFQAFRQSGQISVWSKKKLNQKKKQKTSPLPTHLLLISTAGKISQAVPSRKNPQSKEQDIQRTTAPFFLLIIVLLLSCLTWPLTLLYLPPYPHRLEAVLCDM